MATKVGRCFNSIFSIITFNEHCSIPIAFTIAKSGTPSCSASLFGACSVLVRSTCSVGCCGVLMMNVTLTTTDAVSYTHLDVYKRQAQDGWFLCSMFVSYTDVYLVEIDHFLGHPTVNRNILAINEIVFLLTEK